MLTTLIFFFRKFSQSDDNVVAGPYRVAAVDTFTPGPSMAQVKTPGAKTGQGYTPGQQATQAR